MPMAGLGTDIAHVLLVFFLVLLCQTTFLQDLIQTLPKSARNVQLNSWVFELPTEKHIRLSIRATASKNKTLHWYRKIAVLWARTNCPFSYFRVVFGWQRKISGRKGSLWWFPAAILDQFLSVVWQHAILLLIIFVWNKKEVLVTKWQHLQKYWW